jgi:hypothetical protein
MDDAIEPLAPDALATASDIGRAQNRTGLSDDLKAGIEELSGFSMDEVRVHYDSSKPADLGAAAFAEGTEIHLGPGHERHLAHEAWHVVQQQQGRVAPTMQMRDASINDDSALEREAEEMGQRASSIPNSARRGPAVALPPRPSPAPVIQPFWLRENGAVGWRDDRYFVTPLLEASTQTVSERYHPSKRPDKTKTRTVRVTETKSAYFGLGESTKVYLPDPDLERPWTDVEALVDKIGLAKAKAVFGGRVSWLANDEFSLLEKHVAGLQALSEPIIKKLMTQLSTDVHNFFDALEPEELSEYFEGKPDDEAMRMLGRKEFRSFSNLVSAEKGFAYDDVLAMDPTAAQGAHYVREHGAQSTLHQTIDRAVEYAYLHNNANATKGNWASHYISHMAIRWAMNQIDAQIRAARNDQARNLGVLNQISPGGGAQVGIFGGVRANVSNVIQTNLYEHGNVTGAAGGAKATVTGDYQDQLGTNHANKVAGDFTGSVSGALAPGNTINNQPVTLDLVRGNADVDAKVAAQTAVGNQLNGNLLATTKFGAAQVNLRPTGTADRFDGLGTFESLMDNPINAAGTNWAAQPGKVYGGYLSADLNNQAVSDGAGNNANLKPGRITGQYGLNPPIGKPMSGQLKGYFNRLQNVVNGPRYQNLVVTITNTGANARGAFRPDNLAAIVANADIAGRSATYRKRAAGGPGPPEIQGRLLATAVTINGTLGNLQNAGFVSHHVTSLASMRLSVGNVQKNNASGHPDIGSVQNPTAGNNYSMMIGKDKVEFTLTALSTVKDAVPLQETNFQVLFKLTNDRAATYLPFTAY